MRRQLVSIPQHSLQTSKVEKKKIKQQTTTTIKPPNVASCLLGASQAEPGRCCPLWPLGTLAAAAALLLGLGEGDGAGQGDGADGAARHLSAGHLLLDGWRRTKEEQKEKKIKINQRDASGGGFKCGWTTTCEDVDERHFHVGGVQRRRLHEHEAVLLCMREEGRKEEAASRVNSRSFTEFCQPARGSRLSPAKARASSDGTVRRLSRSLLLPTSITTMWVSPCSYSSFSQRSALSYVRCLLMS